MLGCAILAIPKKLGRIGFRTLLYYLFTTLIAIVFGLVLAFILVPGDGLNLTVPTQSDEMKPALGIIDFLFATVPSNPFAAFSEGNVLQIIVFAIFFAFAINLAGERAKSVLSFLESLSEVMYSLSHLVMKLAPYGVFALIATAVGSVGIKVIYPLLKFLLCNYIAFIFTDFMRLLRYAEVLGQFANSSFFQKG